MKEVLVVISLNFRRGFWQRFVPKALRTLDNPVGGRFMYVLEDGEKNQSEWLDLSLGSHRELSCVL